MRRLIESDQRHLLAVRDAQARDAERTEAVIVLRDVCQLENRTAHNWILLFTSSTTREEDASASTSIFTAARLQAMAP